MSLPEDKAGESQRPASPAAETECQICYEGFDARVRQPKLLSCRHCVCARCLRRLASARESPGYLSCPFCRQEMLLPGTGVGLPQEDGRAPALPGGGERAQKRGGAGRSPEVLLCPGVLEPSAGAGRSSSSDCLVVTLLEMPEDVAAPDGLRALDVVQLYRPPSPTSLPCRAPPAKCQPCTAGHPFPRFLVGVLCLVYFSSLPLGIYLLLVQRLHLGLILVSLVPATLLLCVFYGVCQCLRHELSGCPS
uniref:E3 ubiquitin-protein ligase RNF182 n=1 Tax=Salvator merianae TaxID=96440 RepID=A0A8D0KLN6_SALMN